MRGFCANAKVAQRPWTVSDEPRQCPGEPPMRCLLAPDLHYSLPQFDGVREVAGYFDVVVLGGDHLDHASIVDFRALSAVAKTSAR
jgi:hypothetical protein